MQWEYEEFYERKRAEIAELFTEKKTINAEAMRSIWEQLITQENKEVWYPIAVAVLQKYAEGITTWNGWSTQQKLNFIYYIFVTKACDDIDSDDCQLLVTNINLQRQGGGFFSLEKRKLEKGEKRSLVEKRRKSKLVKRKIENGQIQLIHTEILQLEMQ